jgi:hypothetical protein
MAHSDDHVYRGPGIVRESTNFPPERLNSSSRDRESEGEAKAALVLVRWLEDRRTGNDTSLMHVQCIRERDLWWHRRPRSTLFNKSEGKITS